MKIRFILFLIAGIFFLIYCKVDHPSDADTVASKYLNLNDTADYVGMQTCRTCHPNVYNTFIETGMGKSFDHATKEKSAAKFGAHALVYDDALNLYYKPHWRDSSLYITEFRLENGDTVHKRTERISYVIGSGQHTNSHLIDKNGYVFQAPITFYTQEGTWDMAPGYENGASSRFDRIIATECMTCHNHFPKQVEGSENKYSFVPTGIECERCHGPGEVHVNEKMAGNIIDTSKFIDYSIVVPTDLPVDLEIDVCQRCHLQGTAVLKDGESFFDFKPGMKLNEVMNVFMPRYTNAHDKFIMASQADRMKLSKCYTIGKMSCTNCHDPHKSVKSTNVETFNKACLNCHQKSEDPICSEDDEKRLAVDNNCVHCHMPKSGSIDIPHVRITDHFIRRPIEQEEKNEIAKFIGLECMTTESPTPIEMANGYIALFDKFVPELQMLDSAKSYLDLADEKEKGKFKSEIHYLFARQDYQAVTSLANDHGIENVNDGWTAYRIGESYLKMNDDKQTLAFFQLAVKHKPLNLDFQNKLAVAQLKNKDYASASRTLNFILKENQDDAIALNNLGFATLMQRDLYRAEELYRKSIALDPDYQQAILNLVGLHIFKEEPVKAKKLVNEFLKRFPENQQAKMIAERLKNY